MPVATAVLCQSLVICNILQHFGFSVSDPPSHPHRRTNSTFSQAEYAAAVRETYQELQACITGINEALEEAQQALEELRQLEAEAGAE